MPKHNAHPDRPHKYRRLRLKNSKGFRWRCVHPKCSHWIPDESIEGSECECWRCGKPFIMDRTTRLLKPHCRDCTRRRFSEPKPVEPIEESPI